MLALLLSATLGTVTACTPKIGDKCVLSTDCSTQGDRLCDTSQPGGYCTEFNCVANGCPDQAACVLFDAALPGCTYDDRAGAYGSRVARGFCMALCGNDSDCRGGYVCRSSKEAPWNGVILDTDQTKLSCLVPPFAGVDPDGGADAALMSPGAPPPVCSAIGPDVASIDASTPSAPSATTPEAGALPPLVGPDASVPDAGPTDGGDGG
jgi:hypothetical protein